MGAKRYNPNHQSSLHHHHHHQFQLYQQYLTQWTFHLWIFFIFLVIAGSESGEGSSSSSSSQTSTDEVVGIAEARGPIGCTFPSRWSGHWFQSGVHHEIAISPNVISTKGRCLEVDGEKYLVHQPQHNCYRCLVFSEKHDNVLQYKETYCKPERQSLRHMCSLISGDANLFAMFRLNAPPIDCPLSGPFTFSYDRGYGECGNPESTLDSCTQASRLLFNYQACPDVAKTESVEEELQCLAAWKEGSYRYFVGLIQYRHHASSYEDRFRCFAYEVITTTNVGNIRRGAGPSSHHHNSHNHHQLPQTLALGRSRARPYQGIGSGMNNFNNESRPQSLTSSSPEIVYRVEQSGDATCNGLSTMEGSRTMLLRRAQPAAVENCLFPVWVQTHAQWYSLDQSSIYGFEGNQFRVTNYSVQQLINANGPDSLAMSGSCMKLLEDEPGHHARVILHARAGCKIGYQCMVLHKRDEDILEIQFGEWSRKHEEACSSYYFDPDVQPYITLVSSTPKRAQCPAIGEFSLKLPTHEQSLLSSRVSNFHDEKCLTNGTLRIGCSSLDSLQLEISSQCHDRNENSGGGSSSRRSPSSREVTEYNCHGWWEEDGITYVVTTLSSTSTKLRPKRHCFVLRDSSISSSSSESPQWMRLKQESQEGQMSLFRHSRAAGQRAQDDSTYHQHHHGNSRQMLENPTTGSSTSAALFFFNNNNNNNHAAGKILEITGFADSCRRNVAVRGDLAFNATKIGHCFASSSSPSLMMRAGSGKGDGRVSMIMVMRGMLASISQFGTGTLSWMLPAMILVLAR